MFGLGATSGTEARSAIDVLVVCGPGLGHYFPIAALLPAIADRSRIAVVVTVPPGHALRERIVEDGFQLLDLGPPPPSTTMDRALRVISRRASRGLAPAIARRGRSDGALPPLLSRVVFGLASSITPLVHVRAEPLAALDALIGEHRPGLVLADDHPEVGILAARHGIAWATYATGPVTRVEPSLPTSPAGLGVDLRGMERPVNVVMSAVSRLRLRRAGRLMRRRMPFSPIPEPAEPIARFAFGAPAIDAYPGPQLFEYVGVSYYRRPDDRHPEMPSVGDRAARDTVLVAPGSADASNPLERPLLERLLPALAELSERLDVVVQSNDPILRAMVAEAAPGRRLRAIEQTTEPLYDLYPRLRLTIGHGGYGTINESVAFGSPILTIPEFRGDRMETAQRVLNGGVGATVNRYAATTASLRTVINDLLADESLACRVEKAAAELRSRDTRDAVVTRLRAVLESA